MKKPMSVKVKGLPKGKATRTFTPAAKGKTKSPFGKIQRAKTQKVKG